MSKKAFNASFSGASNVPPCTATYVCSNLRKTHNNSYSHDRSFGPSHPPGELLLEIRIARSALLPIWPVRGRSHHLPHDDGQYPVRRVQGAQCPPSAGSATNAACELGGTCLSVAGPGPVPPPVAVVGDSRSILRRKAVLRSRPMSESDARFHRICMLVI